MWVPEADLEYVHEMLIQYKLHHHFSECPWQHCLMDKERNPDLVEYIITTDIYALRSQRELTEPSQ